MYESQLSGVWVEQLLVGGIGLSRASAFHANEFERVGRALEAALIETPYLPVPTLATDLAMLLKGESLLGPRWAVPHALTAPVRAYEDHFLARLTAHRQWSRLVDAVVAVPKSIRPAAIGLFAARCTARLGLVDELGVGPGMMRRLQVRPIEEILEEAQTALADPLVEQRLALGFQRLSLAAKRLGEVITETDVFLLENMVALQGLASRVALLQVAEVAQHIEALLPRQLRLREASGEIETTLEHEAAYPLGGFSSLSTRGALENLVTSELMYMDSPEQKARSVDLFDLRFIENELLYYVRDEAVSLRRQRALTFVFDASLQRNEVLDPGESYQRLVWLLGALIASVRKWVSWMGAESLSVEFIFPAGGKEGALSEQQEVTSLLLRDMRERRVLTIGHASTAREAIRTARTSHRNTRVVLFSAAMPPGLEGEAAVDAYVELNAPRPRLHWQLGGAQAVSSENALGEWAEFSRQLLLGLLRA